MRKKLGAVLLLAFLLAGCAGKGAQDPAGLYFHTPETYQKTDRPSFRLGSQGLPIQNGAVLRLLPHTYTQTEREGNAVTHLIGVFSEENKTLTPLCFRPDCTHTTETCFANDFYQNKALSYLGAYDGMLFGVSEKMGKRIVDYFTPDGVLVKTVSFQPEEDLNFSTSIFQNGHMLYFYDLLWADYNAYKTNPKDAPPVRRTITSYDMKTEKFTPMAEFTLPDAGNQRIRMEAMFEDRLYFSYDHRFLYVFNASENTVTQLLDYSALSKELRAPQAYAGSFEVDPTREGILTFYLAADGSSELPANEIISYHEYNWNTKTVHDLTPYYGVTDQGLHIFPYKGDFYRAVFERPDDVLTLAVTNLSTGEVSLSPWPQEVFPAVGFEILSETDNGFLFTHRPEVRDWEERAVNGESIVFTKPAHILYISKENLLAGNFAFEELSFPWADEREENHGA